jgi:hypothetical protein
MHIPTRFNDSTMFVSFVQLCHIFQQECRFREATEFMETCSPSWTDCSSFLYVVLHEMHFLLMEIETQWAHPYGFLETFFPLSHRFTHNWWHVAVCYLEGESPLYKVLEVYDQNIMKELERSDSEAAEVL